MTRLCLNTVVYIMPVNMYEAKRFQQKIFHLIVYDTISTWFNSSVFCASHDCLWTLLSPVKHFYFEFLIICISYLNFIEIWEFIKKCNFPTGVRVWMFRRNLDINLILSSKTFLFYSESDLECFKHIYNQEILKYKPNSLHNSDESCCCKVRKKSQI